MQDRSQPARRIFLLRTAGPHSGHNRTHAPQQTSGKAFPAVSFVYLSVDCPFNKFYGINCRPQVGCETARSLLSSAVAGLPPPPITTPPPSLRVAAISFLAFVRRCFS